jgi:hypothetical protein
MGFGTDKAIPQTRAPESGARLRVRWDSQRIKIPGMPFSCDRQEQILFMAAINVGRGMKRTFGPTTGLG